ncbi:MAG TPA: allophanate hydrolase subunit 1 [Mycobacteriales bacterium]|nr:allophanate hydrolase subunit 1 [Mycobacteriales bacterium]
MLPAGDAAVLVELADLDQVGRLYASLRDSPLPGTLDVVPATRTILLGLDPAVTGPDRVAAALRERTLPAAIDRGATRLVEIPTSYDGPDLADVAALTGLGEDEVVRRHGAAEWTVAFCGFAPGFAYMLGGDPALRVPRRETPRTAVPAGSIGLADAFTGAYPRRMPGGWQLIGRTDAVLWDLDRDPPALLPPGTRVRFVPA